MPPRAGFVAVRGNGFDITYTLRNRSAPNVRLVPWEVTRVSGGYIFYPPIGNRIRNDLITTEEEGITWYFYRADKLFDGNNHKVLEDAAEGWIANVNLDTGLFFIKSYPDIDSPRFAPGKAEIELYANRKYSYIEIEQQGACTMIPPLVQWTGP